jgi:hypothetical protein
LTSLFAPQRQGQTCLGPYTLRPAEQPVRRRTQRTTLEATLNRQNAWSHLLGVNGGLRVWPCRRRMLVGMNLLVQHGRLAQAHSSRVRKPTALALGQAEMLRPESCQLRHVSG